MDKEPITVNGLKDLKLELENLKNVKRPKLSRQLLKLDHMEI